MPPQSKPVLARDVPVSPLTGLFDSVSAPEQVPLGSWRLRQNYRVSNAGKMERDFGWRKFLSGHTGYNNQDLHDQLSSDLVIDGKVLSQNFQTYYDELPTPNPAAKTVSSYPPENQDFGQFCSFTDIPTSLKVRDSALETQRQPITMIYASTSTSQQRKLLLGTQTRLYALNQESGNVKLIGDGFGGKPKLNCTGPRFYAAQVGDVVVLTNDYDPVMTWTFDQPTFGCSMRALSTIPDLETLRLSRAGCVYSWKGIIWLGNVEVEGIRVAERILWSDFQAPISFGPKTGSLSGQEDLGYGEKILAFSEVGNFLIVFTNVGIWAATTFEKPDGTIGFNFNNVYAGGTKRVACMAYKNTLVAVGDYLYFAGQDAIYRWTLGMPKPERIEWIHRASGVMFGDINELACEAHVAGFDPNTQTLHVSWVQRNKIAAWPDLCPSKTLAFNLQYEAAHVVDFGFSCYGNWVSDTKMTVGEFILRYCICHTQEDLDAAYAAIGVAPSVKEGAVCEASEPSCETVSKTIPIYTRQAYTIPGTDVEIEDFTKPEADADSLCARLDGLTLEDLCRDCDVDNIFIMASALDFCLKQYGGGYFRERFLGIGVAPAANAEASVKCGDVVISYAMDGYKSVLRSGALALDAPNLDKQIQRVTMEYLAEEQVDPLLLNCRVGISAQPVDPNRETCALLWTTLEPVELKCLSTATTAQHEADNTRPNLVAEFPVYQTGRYIYFEFSEEGRGGAAEFSKVTLKIRPVQAPA